MSPSLISEIGDEVLVMEKVMLDRVEAVQPLTEVAVSLPEPARSELLRAALERAGSMELWLDRVCEMSSNMTLWLKSCGPYDRISTESSNMVFLPPSHAALHLYLPTRMM